MSKQTEELINNGWKLVRDAGATVGEAGSTSAPAWCAAIRT